MVTPFPENEDGSPTSHRQIKWTLLREFRISDSGECPCPISICLADPNKVLGIGQDFIRRLLEYEPRRRMSSSKACKHLWLSNERRHRDDDCDRAN